MCCCCDLRKDVVVFVVFKRSFLTLSYPSATLSRITEIAPTALTQSQSLHIVALQQIDADWAVSTIQAAPMHACWTTALRTLENTAHFTRHSPNHSLSTSQTSPTQSHFMFSSEPLLHRVVQSFCASPSDVGFRKCTPHTNTQKCTNRAVYSINGHQPNFMYEGSQN